MAEGIKRERSNQKLKLLFLMKILNEETDQYHGITLVEIGAKLQAYGINAERKGIYKDIEVLRDFGMDIEGYQKDRTYYYKVMSRDYELAELKLLVDAVQCSRFITEKKSKSLIQKITRQASNYEKKELERHVYVNGRIKSDNKTSLINIDHIHEAITKKKQISFHYFNWTVNKKQELRHGGKLYIISPWELILDNENYYLVAYDSEDKKIKHYRVDKMLDVEVTDVDSEGKDEFLAVDITEYSGKVFGMFGGNEEMVHMLCENDKAGIIIDQFGKDVRMLKVDDEHFEVSAHVAISSHFVSWVMGLGSGIKITGPENVVEFVKNEVRRMKEVYDL